jgi:subtilisin family serine protease
MFRNFFYTSMVLALTLSLCTPALAQDRKSEFAQGKVKSYIVILRWNPILSYTGEIAGYEATKPNRGNKVNPKSAPIRKYVKFLESKHNESLKNAGASADAKVHDFAFTLNGYSAILTRDQADAIKLQKDVVLVLEDKMRHPETDSSPAFLGLTASGSAYAKGYTGKGVVVGIIDTGIWPEHPSFADDGSFSAPPTGLLPCEFGNTAHNPNDAPFTCNNKLIGADQILDTYRALIGAAGDEFDSARDDDGHGSHTASTAAGNSAVAATLYGMPAGTISGIAPSAHVIAYKGLGNEGGFTSDLAAAIEQAVVDGVDVINYSIGGGAGGVGADELAFLFAADAGIFVASSAGNSGPGASTLGDPGTKPWLTTVGASTQSRFLQGTIILGDGAQYTGASITAGAGPAPLVDAASLGNALCNPAVPFSSSVAGKIVVCQRGVTARTAKSLAVFNAGGIGMIMHENSDAGSLFSDTHWAPSVHVDQTPGLAIKAYIAANPSTATAQIVAPQTGVWPYAPSMTDFSSRGPNPVAPDIIKPDVTAPGIQILAANSPFPDAGSVSGELFQAIAGTSMSSPHVAGVFALLKQAHPEWSAAMAKSALMTTAHQNVLDNNRTSPADPFDMGAGHIRPGGEWSKGSVTQPGLAYDAGLLEYLGFMCDQFPEVFANPASTCATLESTGIPTKAYNLNYPSIGIAQVAGTRTVTRTVTSVATQKGWRTYNASVVAPPGYTVDVSPSSIRLRPGDKATFTVTVSNTGAPVGEWRFGSLTWREMNGEYEVYSPIAVKGTLFEAPAEILGSGVSGSASFNVKFGYTGAYTAASHGLTPATVTQDKVFQDVDQTFSPSDVATNGARLHEFNLSGVAHFSIKMPQESTEANADLDIYVYNPSNVLVASSTAGGTQESIDIRLPVDGTWKVYVHGWSTPGGDSDYNMRTWAVPVASGGNLIIDSAPASATIGTVTPVNVSWSGLTSGSPGDWYLGAVSHTGPSGLIGLTLVNVDNR